MDSENEAGDLPAVEPRSGLRSVAIREQLEHILASPEFHATDKVRDFLRFIVEEKLAGRSSRLKGYTIALEVFGRGDDFDAANDPIVRIQAGRLRRSLERYYLTAGAGDPILIDIPKGRYIPRFALQASTAYQPHAQTPHEAAVRPELHARPSVAVIPVQNLTDDAEQLPLATGLTEELATELTRFQDIAVIACHTERQPADFPADPIEIGRRVGARFVLDGTVRQDADTTKVTAHLIDTRRGEQIWADAFTHPRDASRMIATQEQIAGSVVTAVASEYGIIARRLSAESRKKAPSELRTYEAMLRYYNHQISPSTESARSSFPALEAAAEREPEYGPLFSALSTLYCQMHTFDVPGFERPLDTALEYARKGVFLEPGSQLGRVILAYASHLADDEETFREEAGIALSLNPNSPYSVGAIGYMHTLRGEIDIGIPLLERAVSCNPCHPAWFHGGHVVVHLLNDDYEKGLAEARSYRPFIDFWDDVMIAAMLGHLGRRDEARPHVEAIRARKPELAARARELIARSLKIPDLVDDLADGLRRSGLTE